MFYLATHGDDGWYPITGKRHSSSEGAKAELKKLYTSSKIEAPINNKVRVVGDDGLVYFQFYYIQQGNGRFVWKWATRCMHI